MSSLVQTKYNSKHKNTSQHLVHTPWHMHTITTDAEISQIRVKFLSGYVTKISPKDLLEEKMRGKNKIKHIPELQHTVTYNSVMTNYDIV